MNEAGDWGDNFYTCMVCEKQFRNPLFEIARGYERTVFYCGDRMPMVEPIESEGVGTYCSPACLNHDRNRLLERDNVRATYPGIGPIESCSRCGKPVDMTQYHMAWTEEKLHCEWGRFIDVLQPIFVESLAVVCQQCVPVANAAVEQKTSSLTVADVA